MLRAAELEECRWREAAAGAHATAMEEKAVELESKLRAMDAKIAAASGAEGSAAFRIATAERDAQSANERARAALEARHAAQAECHDAQATAQVRREIKGCSRERKTKKSRSSFDRCVLTLCDADSIPTARETNSADPTG